MLGIARLLAALLVILFIPASALAQPVRHDLGGGLTAILSENHESPVVAIQVWVRAGAAYERPKEAGITHFIEHMIFKGTPKVPVGDMARLVEALGGSTNAYTTLDHTNYYVVSASKNAYRALDLLADSVINASFLKPEMEREKEVVVEEIRMNQNDPRRRFSRAVMRQAFGDHPYGLPVLGTEKSVRGFSRQDVLDYVARWYRRPGVLVVAVGDFDSHKMLKKVKSSFAGLKGGKTPDFKLPPVNLPAGPRMKVFREKVRQATISLSWRVPGLPHPDVYALDLAASVAGEGQTSRLFAALKEKLGLVDSVSAYSYTPAGVGVFQVRATVAPDRVNAAWPALIKETMGLIAKPPTEAELKRARVQLAAQFVRNRQTMSDQANQLGYFEFFQGGFEKLAQYTSRFNAVSAGGAAQVLKRHLTPERLSVAIQAPEGAPAPSLEKLAAVAREAYAAAVPPAAAAKAAPAAAKPAAAPQGRGVGQVARQVLSNGLTLVIKPAHAVPTVSYVLAAPSGRVAETQKTAGLSTLWAASLTRGSKGLTYEQLTTRLDDMAGSLTAFAGMHESGLAGDFLSGDWREGLKLMTRVWWEPTFPKAQVERAKREQLAGLRRQQDSPISRAFLAFRQLAYPKHPYGLNQLGSQANVNRFGPKDLAAIHAGLKGPGACVLTVVGDVSAKAVIAEVNKLFGGLKGQAVKAAKVSLAAQSAARGEEINELGASQTQVLLGYPAPNLSDPDRYPASVLKAVLGGMGGRLFMDLREKRSLAYTVQPFYSPRPLAGLFGFYMGVGPGKDKAALAGLHQHIDAVAAHQPSPEEMDRAKGYLIGNQAIGLQSYGSQAMTMAADEILGRGWDYYRKTPGFISKVTAKQVREVAKAMFVDRRRNRILAGPLER